MSLTPAEQKVRKLARLPANSECANCGTAKKFGFSNICIKFHTFVCNNCKSSHQAISHRCKSLTMSSWSDAEVTELQQKGNDYAKRTWLKNAPPVGQGGRPSEGDHIDVFKRFVVDVYERKRYYGEDDGAAAAASAPSAPPSRHQVAVAVPVSKPPRSFAVPAPRPAPRSMPPVQAPVVAVAAPVADLLDFAAPAPSQPAAAAASANGDMFQANFDAFGSSPAPAAAPSNSNTFQANFGNNSQPMAAAPINTNNMFDANFGNFQNNGAAVNASSTPVPAPTTTAPTTSGFSFISSPPPPVAAAAPAASDDFADFTGMSAAPFQAPTASNNNIADKKKKPIMSNQGMNQKASFISSLGTPSGMQQQQGFGGGGGGGMQRQNFGMQQQPQPQQSMMQQNMMAQQQQRMMMQQQQQQQQMMMMQQGMAGMNMGMNQPGMNNNIGMMNPMMMNQQNFGMGGSNNSNNNNNSNGANAMNSLQMNAGSMNSWTTGDNKNKS